MHKVPPSTQSVQGIQKKLKNACPVERTHFIFLIIPKNHNVNYSKRDRNKKLLSTYSLYNAIAQI